MSSESQWVTFKVGTETFGFEIQYVREMLRMPAINTVPCAAPDNLGVILLRSEVIPVFDLRYRFGLESQTCKADALAEMMRARQRDHENWLTELETCAEERREFKLTTDPHQCKFGVWYDSFTTEDASLARLLKRFDEPHKKIHQLAEAVKEMQSRGEHQQAGDLVRASRESVLSHLIQLFSEVIVQIYESARQNLIVVGSSAVTIGLAVDEIQAVVRCRDEEIQAPDSIPGNREFGGLIGLLPDKGHDRFIMLLDPAQLYPQLVGSSEQLA